MAKTMMVSNRSSSRSSCSHLVETVLSLGGPVLVVSEVCAGKYGAGRVRDGSTRNEERLVGRSAAGAAVGVEEGCPINSTASLS